VPESAKQIGHIERFLQLVAGMEDALGLPIDVPEFVCATPSCVTSTEAQFSGQSPEFSRKAADFVRSFPCTTPAGERYQIVNQRVKLGWVRAAVGADRQSSESLTLSRHVE
jgi:hypothetical protein